MTTMLPPSLTPTTLPKVIAVIGCDGSGKSTLTTDLFNYLQSKQAVKLIYLGQSSGNIAHWIKSLPIIGAPFERYLVKKAERAHDKKNSSPDSATIIVIYLLSLWRTHKFRRMLKLSQGGITVITDRYPQAQVPGFHFDGIGLTTEHQQSWLGRKLAAREQRLYAWMSNHLPALVIRLNIDAETAHARKPDHKFSTLQAKATTIPSLHFNGARILDLSSIDPYAKVLESATKAVHQTLQISP